MKYDPWTIETKWQEIWDNKKAYVLPKAIEELKTKPKYYVLDMFPYPSGAGLHVGHPEGYTATDVIARMKRMQGFHVLHPMGWDAFGLPAERAALRENRHPAEITKQYIQNFKKQIKRLGFSYDWEREINTTDPKYYKWTQWIFLKLYEKGLAYSAEVPVNWCPAQGTVLANEEVKDGVYVETGDPVERRLMRQWMLKITAYGDRLLEDLDQLDWPEGIKEMQRNWIGKSEGAEIDFHIKDKKSHFRVFTTRPDTLFGATYCVLAPEHPLVSEITTSENQSKILEYIGITKNKSDLARTDLAKDKTGVFTGSYAIHPVTKKEIPIWISDYVLMSYGHGAIMSVPAHDERDHEFAQKFNLPIVQVISGEKKSIQDEAHSGAGTLINSEFLNNLSVDEAKTKMIHWLVNNKCGESKTQYKLRDWLFSRQRYWGEPFPLSHGNNGEIYTAEFNDLPILLPKIDKYQPTEQGDPPLARADENWLNFKLKDGTVTTRETNTMPQWAGSCWYYLRYMDPDNTKEAWNKEIENYFMPVDLYVGGVEHAVLHLLYARFWHKVLFDCGLVSTKEPFQKLFNQGMILAYSYKDERGKYYHPDDVEDKSGKYFAKGTTTQLQTQIEKMSKSKLNVVNPDDVIAQYGADSMRLYELFMGPLEQIKPWQTNGVEGVYRFLGRVWRLYIDDQTGAVNSKLTKESSQTEVELYKTLHKTIDKVTKDIDALQFNTALSQMMIFINTAYECKTLPYEIAKDFLKILSPFAPHLCEEIWERLGEKSLIVLEPWPKLDQKALIETKATLIIQVNGKKRDDLEVDVGLSSEELKKVALASDKVQKHLEGKEIIKVIAVPNRLVNFVVK